MWPYRAISALARGNRLLAPTRIADNFKPLIVAWWNEVLCDLIELRFGQRELVFRLFVARA